MSASRWQVRATRPVAYDILTVADVFDPADPALLAGGRTHGGRRFVVVDANVARHCGARIGTYFAQRDVDARIVVVAGGEQHKSVDMFLELVRELDAFPIHRRDEPIIAIGGGVLTDLVGFVASSYRRGVPHLKVPTTLMGYVDAAVGIKTGINAHGRKNRLGSFEPPLRVLLDRSLLATLPRRHLRNGVCEIVKLAVIKDLELLRLLERHGAHSTAARFQDPAGSVLLDRAIGAMLEELEPNLFEDNLERRVDFGHTFSYGLETRHGERLLHGEAVLLDILVSLAIAAARGLLDDGEVGRVHALVQALDLAPDTALLDGALMWQSLLDRTEHRNGLQRVPMPRGLGGCVFLNDITRRELDAAIAITRDRTGAHEPALQCG
ncbi:sedoheptulose 7-phosphate cyclase [Pseudoxanthomonas koreensis]|uniref:sedoheptulose 7-phosphate cyclase n=1 Tax=Pseudoxanthomonas koreensis TaxID=266061 RepID=UPI0035A625CF